MKKFYLLCILIVWPALIWPFQGCSKNDESSIYGFLHDEANILTNAENEEITKIIAEHNSIGPGRISVIILKELPENVSIEKCAYDLINVIPSTENDKNDRVLLIIAIHNRKMRIETSKDIWALLTDQDCGNIIKDDIAPEFKKERYYSGLKAGISAITSELKN